MICKLSQWIRWSIFFVCLYNLLSAKEESQSFFTSKYPVDISFFIADLKYSEENGVKICEIQHGVESVFFGDPFLNGGDGIVTPAFYQALQQYFDKAWIAKNNFSFPLLNKYLRELPKWGAPFDNLYELEDRRDFKRNSTSLVHNPHDITNYHGFLAYRPWWLKDYKKFQKEHPGIVLLDAASASYWRDKYKMSELFDRDPILASFKPKWALYPKSYSSNLAEKIANDLKCSIFVIKPRSACKGHGVIIVDKDNLDRTLQYILVKSRALKEDTDPSYGYWYKDISGTFLIEEFIASDPISVPSFKDKVFQPTMRVAFLLVYTNQRIEVKQLYGYWLLPFYALSEKGTLNDTQKAYCKIPYFCQADPVVLAKVNEQLETALSLLYQQMLMEK